MCVSFKLSISLVPLCLFSPTYMSYFVMCVSFKLSISLVPLCLFSPTYMSYFVMCAVLQAPCDLCIVQTIYISGSIVFVFAHAVKVNFHCVCQA